MKKAMMIVGLAVTILGYSCAQCRNIHNHHRGFAPPPPPPNMHVIRRHPHHIHYYPIREFDFYYDNNYYIYNNVMWGPNNPYNRRRSSFIHIAL